MKDKTTTPTATKQQQQQQQNKTNITQHLHHQTLKCYEMPRLLVINNWQHRFRLVKCALNILFPANGPLMRITRHNSIYIPMKIADYMHIIVQT